MSLLDFIFPKSCLGCKKGSKYLCNSCLSKVRTINIFDSKTQTFSIFRYEGVVRQAIIKLKYNFAFDIAGELAAISSQKLQNSSLKSKKIILVPIPLFKTRENWRGFNQAEILGQKIANFMNWQFESNLLMRISDTKPQVGLSKSERERNICGKFALNSEAKIYQNRSYIIFDDVVTTGSTIKEGFKILRQAGVEQIIGLTIAK